MKTVPLIALAALVLIVGCSTTPTKFDRAVADVQTNYVPVLVLKTNVVTLTLTNEVGVPTPVFQTNVVFETNQTAVYTLVPNKTATAVASIAGAATNTFLPGTGTIVTGGILGLLSIFLGFRNRQMSGQNDTLTQAAGVLAQTIETGRELMAKTPQGQQAANAFTQWMVSHQADTNTISAITQIVKDSTDNVQAQAAANQILALIGKTPPPAPPTKAA